MQTRSIHKTPASRNVSERVTFCLVLPCTVSRFRLDVLWGLWYLTPSFNGRAWDEGEIAQRGSFASRARPRERLREGAAALAGSITAIGSPRAELAGSRRGEGCAPGENESRPPVFSCREFSLVLLLPGAALALRRPSRAGLASSRWPRLGPGACCGRGRACAFSVVDLEDQDCTLSDSLWIPVEDTSSLARLCFPESMWLLSPLEDPRRGLSWQCCWRHSLNSSRWL